MSTTITFLLSLLWSARQKHQSILLETLIYGIIRLDQVELQCILLQVSKLLHVVPGKATTALHLKIIKIYKIQFSILYQKRFKAVARISKPT